MVAHFFMVTNKFHSLLKLNKFATTHNGYWWGARTEIDIVVGVAPAIFSNFRIKYQSNLAGLALC